MSTIHEPTLGLAKQDDLLVPNSIPVEQTRVDTPIPVSWQTLAPQLRLLLPSGMVVVDYVLTSKDGVGTGDGCWRLASAACFDYNDKA